MSNRILSCFTNSYGKFGPEAAFELLPQAGIGYVELAIKNHGMPSFFKETPILTDASSLDDAKRVGDQIAAAGLQLSSCNISSGNPLEAAVVERTVRKLDLAQALGVSLIVSGAGEAEDDTARSKLNTHLKQLADESQSRGITYCCETHPGLCQNAEEMLRTIAEVDHPALRLNFDTANLYYYNRDVDLAESLRLVREFVAHVHLKDTPGGFEQWHFDEIGTGSIDFGIVRELLDEIGFAGPYSLELEGVQGEPEVSLDEYQQRIIRSVGRLRSIGY